jgi:hypothetical protein
LPTSTADKPSGTLQLRVSISAVTPTGRIGARLGSASPDPGDRGVECGEIESVREIRLELLNRSHLDDVRALVADPDVLHYTRIPEPPRDDFAQAGIAAYETARKDGTRERFAAINCDGEFVGALDPQQAGSPRRRRFVVAIALGPGPVSSFVHGPAGA